MQTFSGNVAGWARRRSLALVVIGACALAACGDEEEAVVAPPKREAPAIVEAPPIDAKAAEALAYTYNAVNRRDPFKTYFDELAVELPNDTPTTELQRFDLDKLKLVAVVVGTATPMAMLEDPNGRGHTVRIGTLVGKRFGQVKHIRRGELVVQEEFRDFTGKRIPQLKQMKLDVEAARP